MALKPNKKGVVTGTKKANKITWLSSKDWKKAITVNAGMGNDIINFKKSKYKNKLNGQDGNDVIYGGTNIDSINGGNGNDKLYGYNGNDIIRGGNGNDYIDGGNGNNKLYGEYGKNTIKSGTGKDTIYAGTGNDTISAGSGNDVINLTKGGNNTVYGEAGNDTITGGKGNDKISGGKGNDIINAGTGINSLYFSVGDGDDIVKNGGGADTLIFANNTKVYTEHAGSNLVVHYGNGTDKVTVKNYNATHSVQNIRIGNTNYTIEDFEPVEISLARGNAAENVHLNPVQTLTITLENPFGGENYTYEITSKSSQTINLNFLSNGRFRIEGNSLSIKAAANQADDIILWGSHNTIATNDLNDIIRIGGAVDSGSGDYLVQSDYNTVNTGTDDDYVVYFGNANIINGADGNNLALAIGIGSHLNNVTSAYVREISSNIEKSNDGSIGWFNQGTEGGECRLLSLALSLSNNLSDLESYSNYVSILQNNDTYTVTFNNYTGEYNSANINADELAACEYVNGDLDVVLTDLALNKLINQNNDHGKTSVMTARYNTLSAYFFGTEDITFLLSTEDEDYSGKINTLWGEYQTHNISNLEIGISSETNYELGIIGGHAYTLADLNDEYISLINVWDTADILNLDLDTFYGLETTVCVYGRDYYGQHIIVENDADKPVCINNASVNDILQELASWKSNSSIANVQTLTETDNIAQADYLAINSVVQNNYTEQIVA